MYSSMLQSTRNFYFARRSNTLIHRHRLRTASFFHRPSFRSQPPSAQAALNEESTGALGSGGIFPTPPRPCAVSLPDFLGRRSPASLPATVAPQAAPLRSPGGPRSGGVRGREARPPNPLAGALMADRRTGTAAIEAALAHVVQNNVEAACARSDLFERRYCRWRSAGVPLKRPARSRDPPGAARRGYSPAGSPAAHRRRPGSQAAAFRRNARRRAARS